MVSAGHDGLHAQVFKYQLRPLRYMTSNPFSCLFRWFVEAAHQVSSHMAGSLVIPRVLEYSMSCNVWDLASNHQVPYDHNIEPVGRKVIVIVMPPRHE